MGDSGKAGTPLKQFRGTALVVDDNSVNLLVAVNVLKKYGLETAKASSGEEALEILANARFDLLFLDLRMPEMSGEEVLEALRADPERFDQEMRVIILTAAEEGELGEKRGKLDALGAAGYLGKPIDRRAMEEILAVNLKPSAGSPLKAKETALDLTQLLAFGEALEEKQYRAGEGILKRLLASGGTASQQEKLLQIEEAWRDFDFPRALILARHLAREHHSF